MSVLTYGAADRKPQESAGEDLHGGVQPQSGGAPYSQFEMTSRLKEEGIIDPTVYSPRKARCEPSTKRPGFRYR